MLRVAQLGAGRIGRMHARNLANHSRAELAGIYDVDPAASAAAASDADCRAFDSLEALLGDSSIDAVMIATSTDTHCDLIERTARAGKAVLCEKPIDLDIRRVDRCRAVVEKTGARVQIGFNRRFDPSHSALAKAAASGELGRLELGVITSRDPAPPPLPYLRVSGGLFRDMMIHDFDMARFLFAEEPVEVAAMGAALADPAIGVIGDVDAAMATMRMASGALCQVNCSRHCAYGYDQRIEVFGEKGMLVSANPTVTSLERYSSASVAAKGRLHHFFIERYAESYIREIDAFIDALEGGLPLSPCFEDGRRALLLADAAAESSKSGRAVQVRP